eukprot:TRINITY_DN28945_c0_g1_i1.p1 TRINITY_DN28945_c0_g1~~TRINITY_DN28945_c0_g1_i1.p1  ORF type:complete len:330 (+),score=61.22 TRINITY_DN28945_c0_g1_i1:90-992(+)
MAAPAGLLLYCVHPAGGSLAVELDAGARVRDLLTAAAAQDPSLAEAEAEYQGRSLNPDTVLSDAGVAAEAAITLVTCSWLHLPPALLQGLREGGAGRPSKVQSAVLRRLQQGHSVILTLQDSDPVDSYGVAVLQRVDWDAPARRTQVVALGPDRDWARHRVARRIDVWGRRLLHPEGDCTNCCSVFAGGVRVRDHQDAMRRGARLWVGTPQRTELLWSRFPELVDLCPSLVVVDEADAIFSTGNRSVLDGLLTRLSSYGSPQYLFCCADSGDGRAPRAVAALAAKFAGSTVQLSESELDL